MDVEDTKDELPIHLIPVTFLELNHHKTTNRGGWSVNCGVHFFGMDHYDRWTRSSDQPCLWLTRSSPCVSPGRGLLILKCESHLPLCVGLVWFGRSTF